jgi:hypothetical protein
MKGQYYSTHELWGWQHGQGYIGKMVKLLEGTGIKLSITECSPTGDWGKYGVDNDWGKLFNDLRDYHIEIYCILFIVRCEFFGDVFDEIKVFTKEARMIDGKWYKSGDWLPCGYCQKKHLALKAFNQKYYYKQLPLERGVDGMIIRTIGSNETDNKSGYTILLVNELLYKNGFLAANKVGYAYTDYTKAAAIAFINFIKEGYPDDPVKQLLKSDGRIGRQTIRYLIEEIHDGVEREKYQFALEVMASPITIEGSGV